MSVMTAAEISLSEPSPGNDNVNFLQIFQVCRQMKSCPQLTDMISRHFSRLRAWVVALSALFRRWTPECTFCDDKLPLLHFRILHQSPGNSLQLCPDVLKINVGADFYDSQLIFHNSTRMTTRATFIATSAYIMQRSQTDS